MIPGQPPQGQPQPPQGGPPPNTANMILTLLSGAGFKNVAESMTKLSQSGNDVANFFSMPNMPLLMAGAGIKDAGNSMELINPLMKMFMPPPPPPEGETAKPEEMDAAMRMMAARLGPGMSGIQAPPAAAMGGMSPGMPQPPMGGLR